MFVVLFFRQAVEDGRAQANDFCTFDNVLGPTAPADATWATGHYLLREVDIVALLVRPELWVTLGIGLAAILALWVFARATGTIRAGLAIAISMVFLGLLLFPTTITARIPSDMRTEVVTAWQFVIAFYFGSEAVVQALKVWRPEGRNVTGDAPTQPEKVKSTGGT